MLLFYTADVSVSPFLVLFFSRVMVNPENQDLPGFGGHMDARRGVMIVI